MFVAEYIKNQCDILGKSQYCRVSPTMRELCWCWLGNISLSSCSIFSVNMTHLDWRLAGEGLKGTERTMLVWSLFSVHTAPTLHGPH